MGFFDSKPRSQNLPDSMVEGMSEGCEYLIRTCWTQTKKEPENIDYILEPGCGRGAITSALLRYFSKAKITTVDYYYDPIPSAISPRVKHVSGKFAEVFFENTFSNADLIILCHLSDSHGLSDYHLKFLAGYLKRNGHLLTIGDNGNLLDFPIFRKLFKEIYAHGILLDEGVLWTKK